jgi:hypothetical protein
MKGPRFKIRRLVKDLVPLYVADIVEPENIFLYKEPSLAKVAGRTEKVDSACDPALLWC